MRVQYFRMVHDYSPLYVSPVLCLCHCSRALIKIKFTVKMVLLLEGYWKVSNGRVKVEHHAGLWGGRNLLEKLLMPWTGRHHHAGEGAQQSSGSSHQRRTPGWELWREARPTWRKCASAYTFLRIGERGPLIPRQKAEKEEGSRSSHLYPLWCKLTSSLGERFWHREVC